MAACDAYVSLHRSEGTGLTIAEAMALGRPVIATDWSGSTDFVDASNSYPVSYSLSTIPRNVGPYRAGETWAEPDVSHAASLMRRVVANPEEARDRGVAARNRIRQDYSEDAIAALVRARLDVIGSRHRLGALRRELSSFVHDYRGLVQSVRQIAAQLAGPDDIVAIVSRGDGEFLALDRGTAWHFPEARPGVYAGHHPENSAAAIAALEGARDRGAAWLVFPGTAFWWLDHYAGFRDHVERRYRCAWRDTRCVVYDLRISGAEDSR
jgi:Glycosyl transferases group 1